jgi:hypothetical protein
MVAARQQTRSKPIATCCRMWMQVPAMLSHWLDGVASTVIVAHSDSPAATAVAAKPDARRKSSLDAYDIALAGLPATLLW